MVLLLLHTTASLYRIKLFWDANQVLLLVILLFRPTLGSSSSSSSHSVCPFCKERERESKSLTKKESPKSFTHSSSVSCPLRSILLLLLLRPSLSLSLFPHSFFPFALKKGIQINASSSLQGRMSKREEKHLCYKINSSRYSPPAKKQVG